MCVCVRACVRACWFNGLFLSSLSYIRCTTGDAAVEEENMVSGFSFPWGNGDLDITLLHPRCRINRLEDCYILQSNGQVEPNL